MIRTLVTAAANAVTAAATTPAPPADPGFWASIDGGDIATLIGAVATIIAAIIAARVALGAYRTQQKETRRQQKATFFAEAVRAVEDYMEGPYRILRKDGTAQARREITQHISDVKSRISFYTGWMAIHGSDEVRSAYDAYVTSAQREAGPQMTAAWTVKAVKKDKDVPLCTQPLPRVATDTARSELLAAMSAELDQ